MKLLEDVETDAFAVVPAGEEGRITTALLVPTREGAALLQRGFEYHHRTLAEIVPVTVTIRRRAP